tara:strand:- start:25147 stop:28773 length:3627 start_codon:yes stop_codon:yes gene_type:complete
MKVKVNKLPEGYKVKNGQIVKVMSMGGVPYSNTIGPIPEQFANLEAEKGETALTDLTNDGNYELYNIGGKRHQDGGTNLSLPPQSFIFSDTAKMKLNKAQLQNFGINSTKKMSPAAVSKKYPLNKYYSILNDEFVDDISTRSSELMLDKNKMKLSQLAFVSESKKKFEDGVPLAAYPYLMSKDIDPQEFVQKVNKLNEEQAQMQMIDQLPPEEQQQFLALQDFTGGQGGPPQGGPQGGMPPMPPQGGGMPPQGMMPPQQMMAKYGGGLQQFQGTNGSNEVSTTGNSLWNQMTNQNKKSNVNNSVRYNSQWDDNMTAEEAEKLYNWQMSLATGDSIPPGGVQSNIADDGFMGITEVNNIPSVSTPNRKYRDYKNDNLTMSEWLYDLVPGVDMGTTSHYQQGGPPAAQQPQGGQGGGGEMEQIMQMVQQAIEQGAEPEEVIVELLQNQIDPEAVMQIFAQLGMPPEQVEQMIMAVMQQLQGGQQQVMAPQGPPQGPPPGPPQGGMPPEMMAAMQQGQGQPQMKYGGLFKNQSEAPEGNQMHLPSQRLKEVQDITPFNAADFASEYPQISYGRDINEGVNQGSLVGIAKNALASQNAMPDPMYDGRYKDDPQADYAQSGGALNRFVYGGEDYADRYKDYDSAPMELPKAQFGLPKAQYGQDNYNSMMELYNSPDWDMVNDYGYQSYDKMFSSGDYDMGEKMTQEQYEAQFLADQKFKYLMNDEGALDDITITLPNGETVSGADIMSHGAWDNPNRKGGFPSGESNGMYEAVYNAFSAQFPDFQLPALPEDIGADVRQKQSVFNSLGGLSKHAAKMSADGDDSWSTLISNVNLDAFGNDDDGGLGEDRWSKIDGKYGDTYNRQLVTLNNEPGIETTRDVSTCFNDADGNPIQAKVAEQQACTERGGNYDMQVCRCIEKTEIKIPPPPQTPEFWKQDVMKLDALSGLDINKYYPSRQSFTGNFMDPAYKDPTREIAAIGEQAQIAGDLAASMSSGPGLASILSKIQGTAGTQIAGALDKVQNDNISIYNGAEQFNAGVQTNTDVLNQDAGKTFMDAVNLVDQNYDNARNELDIQIADMHAGAWTRMAETANLNSLTPDMKVSPANAGLIDAYSNKTITPNVPVDNQTDMDKRIALEEQYMASCAGPTATTEEKTECRKQAAEHVKQMMKSSKTTADAPVVPPGYQGETGNTRKESKYGSELRRELMMRRGGQW